MLFFGKKYTFTLKNRISWFMNIKKSVGILRETKAPPDRRVPLTPHQTVLFEKRYSQAKVYMQPSEIRGFRDDEYDKLRLNLKEDLKDCELLLGIKEVDYQTFISGKIYMFFAHVGKKQSYNRRMLQEIMRRKITLIDYEYLTDGAGKRIIAFGRWAGIVGAYNGLRGMGLRNGSIALKPAHQCGGKNDLFAEVKKMKPEPVKILVTGGGRTACGAVETLHALNLHKVTPKAFLEQKFDHPVYARLDPQDYVKHKRGKPFELFHFFSHPQEYESTFQPYQKVTDLFIACHYWDPNSPNFITADDMRSSGFRISLIADVSCDINGPIASTRRTSTIEDPFYDYNPNTEKEEPPISNIRNVTVMAVDNLPGALPREASQDFGNILLDKILPSLMGRDDQKIIERATITRAGALTRRFSYLQDFADGIE